MVSMTPEEAQQAETLAEIKTRHETVTPESWKYIEDGARAHDDRRKLLEIVDSQTQKIEAMQKQLNAYSLLTEAAGSLIQKQYTEEDLREYWKGKQAGYFNESKWQGFIECARFLGAIKEKEKT